MAKTITLTQDTPDFYADLYLYPDGDISSCTQLTAVGDNPNYLCVDEDREIPDDDETYVSWNTSPLGLDLYNLPNSSNLGTIQYIQVYTRTKSHLIPQHVDSVFKVVCSPDSVCTHVYKSDNQGLVTSYKKYYKVWTENPFTSAAWTWGNINTLAIGEECSSQTIYQTMYLTLRPNAAGAFNQHFHKDGRVGNVNNYEEVDEISRDDDGSYIAATAVASPDDQYNVPNHTTETGTIKKVTVFAWCRKYLAGGVQKEISIYVGGNFYRGGWTWTANTYTLYSHTWANNPATGIAWTWNDIDNLQIGLHSNQGIYCTQIYAVVEYEESTNPEIRTTQCYVKVNYLSTEKVCNLNSPSEVGTNHARNIKMMNMWNGDRVVYSLNRSGKSLVLQGVEYASSSALETVVKDRIECMKEMGKNGDDTILSGFSFCAFNGTYKIRSFGWDIIQEKPIVYKWFLELEDSEL